MLLTKEHLKVAKMILFTVLFRIFYKSSMENSLEFVFSCYFQVPKGYIKEEITHNTDASDLVNYGYLEIMF